MARNRRRPAGENPIPSDWAEMIGSMAEDPAYIKAWIHAEDMGNPPKACMVYAENHWQEYSEDHSLSVEDLKEKREELDRQIAAMEQEEARAS